MDESLLNSLLQDLKNPDEAIRERATHDLWGIWYQQKGVYGLEMLQRSQFLLDAGKNDPAEAVLTQLIAEHPDFAEAWNRRAVLYYILEEYHKSIDDCQVVVKLNPSHFGAFHGMGLCYIEIDEYRLAIQAFQRALEIQPYALENQRLILECTAWLS